MSFQRYADGKLKHVVSGTGRKYRYDHVGRIFEGLTGEDATGQSGNVGPYKQTFSHNPYSEVTGISAEVWGQTPTGGNYSKSYDAFTGRDANSDYDAAGNITEERIGPPTSQDIRQMKYDAAGRQIEILDPAIRASEVDVTYLAEFDGNGWQSKKTEQSPPSNSLTTYEIRSTVLAGETVGEYIAATSPETTFTVPIGGGRLTHSNIAREFGVNAHYRRISPEGVFEYLSDNYIEQFDPRGAATGTEEPTADSSGNYPASADPSVLTRCAEGGIPQSCDMESRFNEMANRIDNLLWDNREDDNDNTGGGPSVTKPVTLRRTKPVNLEGTLPKLTKPRKLKSRRETRKSREQSLQHPYQMKAVR